MCFFFSSVYSKIQFFLFILFIIFVFFFLFVFLIFLSFVCSVYLLKGLFCSSCTSQSLFVIFLFEPSLCAANYRHVAFHWSNANFAFLILFVRIWLFEGDLCAILGLEILLAFHAFVNSLRLDLLPACCFCSNVKVGFLGFSIVSEFEKNVFFIVFVYWFLISVFCCYC